MRSSAGTITVALVLCIFLPIGISRNLLIIWSILAQTHQRSITTLLILNLAFADGFLMFLLPFFIVYLVKHTWIFTLPLCKILLYLCSTNMYSSVFLITLMSLHRMVAIFVVVNIYNHKILNRIWTSFHGFASMVTFISSSVNPVLYTFARKSFIKRDGLAFMARLF
ncbi:leukotriene B4 receptor 1-like [Danio aesculapii]|uniref:leukotriene B4 receptor 1-like n=1 Tax=Danio aesculapii TaxID=1142201 RepID=UPI0024BFAA39|nr:leukotriene B4 receptor 1-like [Danio aesculapii]